MRVPSCCCVGRRPLPSGSRNLRSSGIKSTNSKDCTAQKTHYQCCRGLPTEQPALRTKAGDDATSLHRQSSALGSGGVADSAWVGVAPAAGHARHDGRALGEGQRVQRRACRLPQTLCMNATSQDGGSDLSRQYLLCHVRKAANTNAVGPVNPLAQMWETLR